MPDSNAFLYERLLSEFGKRYIQEIKVPELIPENLNPAFPLRHYQTEAFQRFICYYENKFEFKECPIHLLYNMATGSGKTLLMAGFILYLYDKGYRNFLFFVNSKNIIEKTKDNFLNSLSPKYLFKQKIVIKNKQVRISQVDNFEGVNKEDINICFTTIQKLHEDLTCEKENSLTFQDFKGKRIVLLSDEAHHGQVKTKQKTLTRAPEKPTWENTVENIFRQDQENILLEFTATMDFMNKAVEDKYRKKIIHKYDLKEFRNDGFSKEVELLKSDTDKKGRILLALILNQYKQDVANKHGINLKPVMLFKAQKTIKQSEENKALFHKIIETLSEKNVEEVKSKTDIPIIKKAFSFFSKEGTTPKILVQKLKANFAENKCLSVNDESQQETYQLLLNTLEKPENKIRAVFAVHKCTEGWDVLNLFDIVRVHEGQAGGGGYKGKISPATLSEAQLVGRGARYYPFIKEAGQDRYKRKYDHDLDNELRILEELHYHSYNESRYIAELKKALVNEGLMDDKTVEKQLRLRDSFKSSRFYKAGKIFLNARMKNDYANVKGFEDLGVKEKAFKHELHSFKGKVTDALTDDKYDNLYIKKESKTLKLSEIEPHVIINAMAKKEFFKFCNLKKFFPHISSVKDLLIGEKYLADISITFIGLKEDIQDLSNADKFRAVLTVLDEIEAKLKSNFTDYKGSEEFSPNKVSEVFFDKKIKVKINTDGQEAFLQDKEWHAFEANYGTSEEKAFVELISRLIDENFRDEYEEIYLLRNELHFKIYNFKDGQAFAPDYVLFMKDRKGQQVTYQVFIEPKGKFLEKEDAWKQEFLLEIKERFSSKGLLKFIETYRYRVIGVPFYNQAEEAKFKEEFLDALN